MLLYQVFAAPITLNIIEKEIRIDGKEAKIFALAQPDGTNGLTANKGENFNVTLVNKLAIPTSIHWHGILLPNGQDGVAFVTQFPIYPNTSYHYQYPLLQAGTFFMHSHYALQEQLLLTAPLILHDQEDETIADQEVVVLLSDFSFKSPMEIYQKLRNGAKKIMENPPTISKGGMDVVEVDYDAFLANWKTADEAEVFEVKPGSRIRLRIINASSATNFFIDLDKLEGDIIAVDGNRTLPLHGKQFELGVAQRIDLLIIIPKEGGSFPIYAKGEGTKKQAGIILSTKGAPKIILSKTTEEKSGVFTNKQEALLKALHPLSAKVVDQQIFLDLGGDMLNYVWTINGQAWPEVTPIVVREGKRVEITFKNSSTMTHPMHLHGHVFQVTAINDQKINGAMRDTVLVTPNSSVSIQFDADNPGIWPLHCHVLYHLEAGMMTVVRYKDYIQPLIEPIKIQ